VARRLPGRRATRSSGARADSALERLRSTEEDALAFAHGHILRVVAARWIGMEPAAGARFALRAGAVCALGFERQTEVVVHWNT